MYAWTNIQTGKDKAGRGILTRCGEEVTASSLGLTKEQFSELVRAGAIRKEPYPPITEGSTLSPVEYNKRMILLAEGNATPDIMDEAHIVRVNDGQFSSQEETEHNASRVLGRVGA